MPWFVTAYLLLIGAMGVYSFLDDRKEGRSAAYLAIDAAVTGSWGYFVIAYFRPGVAEPIGLALPLLLLFSLAWVAADAWCEMRRAIAERPAGFDPELSIAPTSGSIAPWRPAVC
jgi:hypothetical protein